MPTPLLREREEGRGRGAEREREREREEREKIEIFFFGGGEGALARVGNEGTRKKVSRRVVRTHSQLLSFESWDRTHYSFQFTFISLPSLFMSHPTLCPPISLFMASFWSGREVHVYRK